MRIAALGKKGAISQRMAELGKLPPEERKAFGQANNELKAAVSAALEARKAELEQQALSQRLATEQADITLPVRLGPLAEGHIHPVSQVFDECVEIFADMGFSVAEGPDIETDDLNFTKLNIPAEHPARQEHDTFYFHPQARRLAAAPAHAHLARADPHDDADQAADPRHRAGPRLPLRQRPDAHADVPPDRGPRHRRDDALRPPQVGAGGVLQGLLRGGRGEDAFRASHFPFREPSAEVDIGAEAIGKPGAWLEILGCGMVHPNVLRNCRLDPERYQGFAFGTMGLDRLTMLKYGLPDLRAFFSADLRWLRHYGFAVLDVPTLGGELSS